MPKVKLPRTIRDLAKKANGDCGEAALRLFLHYRDGTGGVEKNDELFRQWLTRAAELGDANAQYNLGLRHYIERDYDAASEWYLKAAAQNHTGAMNYLGWLYYEGLGVEKNKATAAQWFLGVALKGNADAQNRYEVYLLHDLHEYVEAMKWFERAAEQGHSLAMSNIALNYCLGQGVEPDVVKAQEWLTKAAEHGDEGDKKQVMEIRKTLRRRCLIYTVKVSGLTMSHDAVDAFESVPLLDHVPVDDVDITHDLALCFLHGRCGLEMNLRLAKDWFKFVVERCPDNTDAAVELKKLRLCVTCGKKRAWETCKLCRSVRYCDKRCQQRDWNRGEPPHKETCPRAVTMMPRGWRKNQEWYKGYLGLGSI